MNHHTSIRKQELYICPKEGIMFFKMPNFTKGHKKWLETKEHLSE